MNKRRRSDTDGGKQQQQIPPKKYINPSTSSLFRQYFNAILENRACGRFEPSHNRYEGLQSYISRGNINGPLDELGETALTKALRLAITQSRNVKYSQVDCTKEAFYDLVRFLLENGASITAKESSGLMPIHIALSKGSLKALEVLLNINGINNVILDLHRNMYFYQISYSEILQFLVLHNDEVIFRQFLNRHKIDLKVCCSKRGVDKCYYFRNPLLVAIEAKSSIEIIETLLDFGADVNVVHPGFQSTPLHLACHLLEKNVDLVYSHKVCQSLLNFKADVNALDVWGSTPLKKFIKSVKFSNNYSERQPDILSILRLLIGHIGKMVALGEYVDKVNMDLLKEKYVSEIYENVQKEILDLKRTIDSSTSFCYFDILTKDIDVLGRFLLKQKDLLSKMDQENFRTKYPIYCKELVTKIQNANHRQKLVEEASKVFRKHVNDNIPFEIILRIWKHLRICDLANFSLARTEI